MSNQNKKRVIICLVIVFAITSALVLGYLFKADRGTIQEVTYDKIVFYVKAKEISKIETQQNSFEISVTLKDETKIKAIIPNIEEFTAFVSKEIENGAEIEFSVKQEGKFGEIFSALVPSLVIYAMMLVVFPKIMASVTGGKYEVTPVTSNVKFDDVAGIEEEKAQLEEIVKFLTNPQEYISSGARIPKGVLLNGAPGTGKTLLAKAIAGEAGVPFFQANGSSFEEKYVGVGASRIRELFKKAKQNAPCIIFIDEIDSVAQNRYDKKSYSEQTLNQLLAEMDGFETKDNIIVIAATNHVDVLDNALTRAGRFDRHVFVPMPDVIAREAILKVHAKNKRFCQDVHFSEIAKKTVGFSGADLENVLNEAAIYCVNNGKKIISNEDIDEAIARVLVGLKKKNAAITESDKRLTAVHEAGHAIVSSVVRPDVKNFGISIVPRGKAGGYNFFDESDKTYLKKSDLFKELQVLYAGRIAEEVVLGECSNNQKQTKWQSLKDFAKRHMTVHILL